MKILILGSSGFLGAYLTRYLSLEFNIYVSYRKDFLFKNNKYILSQSLLSKLKECDVCINCIADTNFSSCKKTGPNNIANIKIPELISKNLSQKNYLIHFSSDIFYENKMNNSTEEAKINLVNEYAIQKRSSEKILISENSIILRTSFYGNNHRNIGLLSHIKNTIRNKETMQGWNNVFSSSVHISHLAKLVDVILKAHKTKDISGIYNFGSQKYYSKYYFTKEVLKYFGLVHLLEKVELIDKNIPRNYNSGMSSKKIQKDLNIEIPSIDEVIKLSIEDIS